MSAKGLCKPLENIWRVIIINQVKRSYRSKMASIYGKTVNTQVYVQCKQAAENGIKHLVFSNTSMLKKHRPIFFSFADRTIK